jgi:hypothetical protein
MPNTLDGTRAKQMALNQMAVESTISMRLITERLPH